MKNKSQSLSNKLMQANSFSTPAFWKLVFHDDVLHYDHMFDVT